MALKQAGHFDDAIAVFEDVNESIYRVDRMLMQLRLSGALDGCKAIVFGQCTDCPESADDGARSLRDVVLETAEAQGIMRIVLASSFSVLGLPFAPRPVTLHAFPVTEDHPTAPQDLYAVTKWLSEEMVDAWTRRTGGSAISLRMPWLQSAATFAPEVSLSTTPSSDGSHSEIRLAR